MLVIEFFIGLVRVFSETLQSIRRLSITGLGKIWGLSMMKIQCPGQSLTEYGIVMALVLVVSVVGVKMLGQSLNLKFQTLLPAPSQSMQGPSGVPAPDTLIKINSNTGDNLSNEDNQNNARNNSVNDGGAGVDTSSLDVNDLPSGNSTLPDQVPVTGSNNNQPISSRKQPSKSNKSKKPRPDGTSGLPIIKTDIDVGGGNVTPVTVTGSMANRQGDGTRMPATEARRPAVSGKPMGGLKPVHGSKNSSGSPQVSGSNGTRRQ